MNYDADSGNLCIKPNIQRMADNPEPVYGTREFIAADWLNIPGECRRDCDHGHDARGQVEHRGDATYTVQICRRCGYRVGRIRHPGSTVQPRNDGYRGETERRGLKARAQIIQHLKEHGPATATDITQATAVNARTVRFVLRTYLDDFVVVGEAPQVNSGMPARIWGART